MLSKKVIQIASMVSVAGWWQAANAAGDIDGGRAAYQIRCAACHSVDFNGAGPSHRDVFGRKAAAANGFGGYSAALKASSVVWTEPNLDRWLSDPEKMVPGQAMGVNVPDGVVRVDLIAYLKSLSSKKLRVGCARENKLLPLPVWRGKGREEKFFQ